jgi:hypothetical protein
MCNAANRPKPGCATCEELFSAALIKLPPLLRATLNAQRTSLLQRNARVRAARNRQLSRGSSAGERNGIVFKLSIKDGINDAAAPASFVESTGNEPA